MAETSGSKKRKNSAEVEGGTYAEDFQRYMADVVAKGHICLSIALGHELRLFDVLGGFDSPITCRGVAEAAGCKEGYIEAWLKTMVAGKIVETVNNGDGQGMHFYLPKERLSSLTSRENNLACLARQVPIYSAVYPDIVKCLKTTGPPGVSYDKYSVLDAYWDETSRMMHSSRKHLLFILDQVPGLTKKLENGIKFCDVGCGPGYRAILVAQMFPNSDVMGVDASDETLALARSKAEELQIPNVTFKTADGTALPEDWAGIFDYVTMSDVIHHVKNQEKMLSEIYRILKLGGIFSLFDFDVHKRLSDNYGKPSSSVMFAFNLFFDLPATLGDDAESAELRGHQEEAQDHAHGQCHDHSATDNASDHQQKTNIEENDSIEDVCEGFEKPLDILKSVGFATEIKQIPETLECHIVAIKNI